LYWLSGILEGYAAGRLVARHVDAVLKVVAVECAQTQWCSVVTASLLCSHAPMTPPDLRLPELEAIPNHHDLRTTTPPLAALRIAEEHENLPLGITCFFFISSCDQL
jgi:hypothetical protein